MPNAQRIGAGSCAGSHYCGIFRAAEYLACNAMKKHLLQSFLRSRDGRERLWKVWWLCGIPVAWATSALVIGAEALRIGGHPAAGDWLDVVRLLIYILWAQLAWRCAHNVETGLWEPMSRFALMAGLVLAVLL
jgi:hypothetical protein